MPQYLIKRTFTLLNTVDPSYPIKVVFSDGQIHQSLKGEPRIVVTFKSRGAEWKCMLLTHIGFLEGYAAGSIDIDGDDALRRLIRISLDASAIFKEKVNFFINPLVYVAQLWFEFRKNNISRTQAKKNAEFHYSLPSAFFKLILGPTYGYTEGYYEKGDEDLDTSQHQKFDYICRKLRLTPGDKLVEVGSAWGYMSLLAAEKYGANVTNYGLVAEQNRVMQEQIDARGLRDRVRILEKDHRALSEEVEIYDKYVSIGVYEHAGKDCHEEWIRSIATSLKPGGVGVLSTMTHMDRRLGDYFIVKHIFPGGYFPSLAQTLILMEKYGLTVLDTESLREHYARAVEEWRRRFIQHWEEIHSINPKLFNESFRRTWLVYLTGSAECFRGAHEKLNVFHIVFTKGRNASLYPLTRDFLYSRD